MRITFVLAAADLSGGNRVISIYANRLANRGHQVTVVSRPRRPVSLKDKFLAWLGNQPIPKNQKSWPSHFDNFAGHRQIESYRPIGSDDLPDADVVIATWWETAEWVVELPQEKGRKIYFIQHYEAHPGQDTARVDATWKLPMHKIVVSKWLAERAVDDDVSLVPNAVDLQQFNAPPRGKQPTPTVGLMYSIVPFKGCDVSLKAFELARQKIPNLKLVAFGNRAPTSQLPLPVDAQFSMRPPQDGIRDIYSCCDVWLVGSRNEGFGLPILEAMACRTPVIATRTGAAPELLADGGGAIVPIEDAASIANQIERIVTLPDEHWRIISNAAYRKAVEYSWDDAADLFEAALK